MEPCSVGMAPLRRIKSGEIEPLEALVKLADSVLVGGGMANTFLAARGVAMGGSLVDNDSLEIAKLFEPGVQAVARLARLGH